jgi:Ser/Thr protein kinase RdoA (MazF antagonist)
MIWVSLLKIERVLLDMEHVERFVKAYQDIQPLSMGELWALPIMLRFSILECLVGAVSRLSGTATRPEQELVSSLNFVEPLDDLAVVENSIRSLRTLSVYDWKHFLRA